MNVLHIVDVPRWAFDQNVRDLAVALPEFEHSFWYMVHGQPPQVLVSQADAIYCAYRWDLDFTRDAWKRAIGSLRCEVFDVAHPGPPTIQDVESARRFGGGFHTVTYASCESLRAAGLATTRYLTNPINMDRFPAPTSVRDRVVASWSGHMRHPHPKGLDVKGFESIVLPAVRRTNVELVYAERVTRPVLPANMPEFYKRGNVTLCASIWEGASNSVMEAMAMGHAVISTRCGNIEELRESELKYYGASGIILAERNPEAFGSALSALTPARACEMGEINRCEIADRWSWEDWREGYAAMLREAMR